ncbi:cytochrome c biogenesis protein CcdA [Haloactinopolyspora alba]|uniref:Cytochrome c biogenesis protein CcdA n=1 Tax=Haloactinopolyspora alba TaxID=648780 RepID=A0A2P8E9J1_9ACTN|nr:cytochrome c biogenesis protein CcdA [Haloactinopolyspora alba]PSL06151.1 cytochrome c biogenesis protein CcdA [Haloactinopolyspora alba]
MSAPDAPYQFALVLGMLAALNPCGFALLPTYLTLLVAGGSTRSTTAALRRAVTMTAAMTAGFIAVFGAFGLVVVPAAWSVERFLPWATVIVGAALVTLGGWLVSGRELVLRVPRLSGGAPSHSPWSMLVYGVAYAVASLSCTVAPFLALATSTFSSGVPSGLAAFVTYGAGMGLVVGVLAVAVALGSDALVRRARRLLPYVSRGSGVLLLVAGAYVAYYGVYELRVNAGSGTDDPVIDAALSVQGTLTDWASAVGPGRMALALAAVVVVVVTLRTVRWRGHPGP